MPQKQRFRKYWKWQRSNLIKMCARYTETAEQAAARAKRNEALICQGLIEWHPVDLKLWYAVPDPEQERKVLAEARLLQHVYKTPII